MQALVGKSRAGTLTADETAEIEACSRVNSLLCIMKSNARRALRRCGTNGKAKIHLPRTERALEELVWERAGHCCEYCRMPQQHFTYGNVR
jgi:hypothetical protein